MTPRLLIAFSLLFAAACAEDITALAPFPCATDRSCPEPLTCSGSVAPGGAPMCVVGCSSSIDCEEGWSCGAMDEGEGGACLQDCELFGSDCELGTTCRLQPRSDEGGFFATCVAITAENQEAFAVCEKTRDCAPQASCYKSEGDEQGTCRPNCDKHHECRHGMSCEPLLPSGAGVCL